MVCDPVPFPIGKPEYDSINKVTCWNDFYRGRSVVFLQQKSKQGESKRDRYVAIRMESYLDKLRCKLKSFVANQSLGTDNEIEATEVKGKAYYQVTLERIEEDQTQLVLKAVCTNPRENDKKIVSRIDIKDAEEFIRTLWNICYC